MDRRTQLAQNFLEVTNHFFPDEEPVLVAVSKRRPIEDIELAYSLGVRDFGENRIDELVKKAEYFDNEKFPGIRWHFIGNIQTNKINKIFAIPNLYALHSVDSLKLLKALGDREDKLSSELLLFIQINTSNEEEKAGLTEWDELAAVANYIEDTQLKYLKWHGLMTMGKLRTEHFEEDALKCFERLKQIRDQLAHDFGEQELKLSMGMSGDFKLALQAGTDYLRIGSTLFK